MLLETAGGHFQAALTGQADGIVEKLFGFRRPGGALETGTAPLAYVGQKGELAYQQQLAAGILDG